MTSVSAVTSFWGLLSILQRWNVEGELIVYQWKVLPFGLAITPRVFTNLLAPVAAPLHLSGCLMYPYIDNIFLCLGFLLSGVSCS